MPAPLTDREIRRLNKLAGDMRPAKGMPSYLDLVRALCDVTDGTQDHDMINRTGSEADAEFAIKTRAGVRPLWLALIDTNEPA